MRWNHLEHIQAVFPTSSPLNWLTVDKLLRVRDFISHARNYVFTPLLISATRPCSLLMRLCVESDCNFLSVLRSERSNRFNIHIWNYVLIALAKRQGHFAM